MRPIVFPSRIPETESDSWTIEDTSASDACRAAVTFLRCAPTRFVSQTNSGRRASENAARRQSSSTIATTVASTVVTFASTDVAVEVTTFSMPPMSFAIRLCTSPVRVRVKNASDNRWRWRYTCVRRSCITFCPTWFESSVCQTPSTPVTIGIATIPATSTVRRPTSSSGIATSRTSRRRNGDTTPSAAETKMSAETALSRAR